jgi:hypothetical protein
VRRVIDEAAAGHIAWDFHQQPPFGFHNVIYLAETADCVALCDADDALAPLKASVRVYPGGVARRDHQHHRLGAPSSALPRRGRGGARRRLRRRRRHHRGASHLTQVVLRSTALLRNRQGRA